MCFVIVAHDLWLQAIFAEEWRRHPAAKANANMRCIEHWFPVETPSVAKACVPTVFFLDGNANANANEKGWCARWYYEGEFGQESLRRLADEVHTVQWQPDGRRGIPLTITVARGRLSPTLQKTAAARAGVDAPASRGGNCRSVPYLKSHLQKSIRKGNARLAVATARDLLAIDVLQVVRRLGIIMVEDVDLHPSFNVLMWWTIVLSKQSAVRKQLGQSPVLRACDVSPCLPDWLLGVVHLLCNCSARRPFAPTTPSVTSWQRAPQLRELHRTPPPPHTQGTPGTPAVTPYPYPYPYRSRDSMHNTLWSVMLRATYGGLKGDMVLLQAVVATYYAMLQPRQPSNPEDETPDEEPDAPNGWCTPVVPICYDSVPPLEKDHWDLDAIDFHVAPHILQHLRQHPRVPSTVDVKRMMWENGSSVNIRDRIHPSEHYAYDTWTNVLHSLRNLQTDLLGA